MPRTMMDLSGIGSPNGRMAPASAGLRAVQHMLVALVVLLGLVPAAMAAPGDQAFTIGKYPVDAVAADAVTAKDKAVADGQQAALRSLFKRLVPVTHYARINRMQPTPKAADYIDGVGIQSERNSSTQYIGSLDFSFRPQVVRELLRQQGIPFVDTQSPRVAVLPVFRTPKTAAEAAGASDKQWADAWSALDADHALTPLRLAAKRPDVAAQTIDGIVAGDTSMLRLLAKEYGSELAIVAIAEPDPAMRRLTITLAGQDAVGYFSLKRTYRYATGDLAYALELASVVALGTLEGRWKALKMRGVRTTGATGGGAGGAVPVQLFVEYRSLQEWSELREKISTTPGVQDLLIGGVAPRGADIALRYPGGAEQLVDALRAQGLAMVGSGGYWTVRSGG